jgi:hypothetical protein
VAISCQEAVSSVGFVFLGGKQQNFSKPDILHTSPVSILVINSIYFELLAALLNKPQINK